MTRAGRTHRGCVPDQRDAVPVAGFTTMELLAVIVIIAVVASIAEPAVSNFFSNQKAAAAALEFIQDVRGARYGAMEDNVYRRVTFLSGDSGYDIQSFACPATWTEPSEIPPAYLNDALTDPKSKAWPSELGEPREFEDGVTVTVPPTLRLFFIRPDGMLVSDCTDTALPIPESIATFSVGFASLRVLLNGAGVRASEEFYEE